jgi:hypothetical protein
MRLLDVPTIAWPSSFSLLDDLIRWSAQRLDHQINLIRSISVNISNHALILVGQSAIVSDKATVVGRPRVRQGAPSLGSVRRGRQEGLGHTRDSENLVGHSLAL